MFPYDRFVKFEELTALLRNAVDAHPRLARLSSLGNSYEGRSIWCVTLTNHETGDPSHKPAFYVDANIHATELSGSVAALKLIDTLLSGYGVRQDVSRLLDTRTIYVIPRVNPDGAEWAMAERPRFIRSSVRPYPYDEDAIEGLEAEDIDGDGRILMMRFRDDNGPWKKHPAEPRLMVRRDPVETGGEYYRIVSEGRVKAYDGFNLPVAKTKTGLDLNRNFPEEWRPESTQLGAGDFPTSEPEVRSCVEFINTHRNICGGVFFHTWSGVLLRPFGTKADDEMPPEDLWVFQTQGKKGEELTGFKRKLFFWALDLGLKYEPYGKNGFWYETKLNIARKLIFSKWKEGLGGNLTLMVSGSAPLQHRLIRVFAAAGMPVMEGYGLTETSPVISVNDVRNFGFRIGSVGKPIQNLEVKIAEFSNDKKNWVGKIAVNPSLLALIVLIIFFIFLKLIYYLYFD